MENSYRGSDAVALLSTLKTGAAWIFVFDLDGTLAEDAFPTNNEIVARHALMELVERQKGVYVFSTARTPELLMSRNAYATSCRNGFDRPPPKWGVREDGTRCFVPLEEVRFFDGLLDPPIMNCFGTGIYLRHRDGFVEDREYRRMLGGSDWRAHARAFIEYADNGIETRLAPIEASGAYERDLVNVAPLPYRLELSFAGERAEAECSRAGEHIGLMQHAVRDGLLDPERELGIAREVVLDLIMVDESHPRRGRYQRYPVPSRARKEFGIERLTNELARASGIERNRFRSFVAGDTMTDLPSLLAAVDAGGVGVLAGGSRLAPEVSAGTFFAEQIPKIVEQMTRVFEGVYRKGDGTFIVADQAFPGLKGAESVFAAAKQYFSAEHRTF